MTQSLRDEVLAELEKLPEENLRVLLETLRREPSRRIRYWNPAFGALSERDARQMTEAIDEAFEQPDESLGVGR